MAQTDPIGDFINSVKMSSFAKKESMEYPSSNLLKAISGIMKREGFIRDFREIKDKKQGMLKIYLKYSKDKQKEPAITDLKRVSRPGRRIYKNSQEIPAILGGRGIALISTSKGILTDNECRTLKLGGEPLCYIW